MGLPLLTERHAKQIAGMLSYYDRVIVQGTLPACCYAEGMTAYLSKRRIRIFDFTQFAKPLTDAIKANAEEVAAANGIKINYVRKKNFRKEDRVKAALKNAELGRRTGGQELEAGRNVPTDARREFAPWGSREDGDAGKAAIRQQPADGQDDHGIPDNPFGRHFRRARVRHVRQHRRVRTGEIHHATGTRHDRQRRSSFERRRDLNLPEQRAAQRAYITVLTPSSSRDTCRCWRGPSTSCIFSAMCA
jgi:hypothetical protein